VLAHVTWSTDDLLVTLHLTLQKPFRRPRPQGSRRLAPLDGRRRRIVTAATAAAAVDTTDSRDREATQIREGSSSRTFDDLIMTSQPLQLPRLVDSAEQVVPGQLSLEGEKPAGAQARLQRRKLGLPNRIEGHRRPRALPVVCQRAPNAQASDFDSCPAVVAAGLISSALPRGVAPRPLRGLGQSPVPQLDPLVI
jgi:hypothetical protein